MNAMELGAASAAESSAANILIVDDLPEKLLVFQSILEDLGQNLVMVRSGQDALRQLLQHEFAVILLDVNMPDIDGFETAALIRQYKRTAQTPIIFITAYADDIQTTRGYSLGAVDYITTPVIPEILRSKVKVFVDLHRMNRQVLQWAHEREALVRAEAARAAAEEATRRADFLAEASHMLTRSLDADSIVLSLLNLMVPRLADVAVLTLVDGNGKVRRRDCIAQHAGMLLDNRQGLRIIVPQAVDELAREAQERRENLGSTTPGIWNIAGAGVEADANAPARRCSACCCSAREPSAHRPPPRMRCAMNSSAALRSRSKTDCSTARSRKAIAARTSSWRCSRTNCGTRWRRSATRCTSCNSSS
jgi:CheY-like chemotaxis protein